MGEQSGAMMRGVFALAIVATLCALASAEVATIEADLSQLEQDLAPLVDLEEAETLTDARGENDEPIEPTVDTEEKGFWENIGAIWNSMCANWKYNTSGRGGRLQTRHVAVGNFMAKRQRNPGEDKLVDFIKRAGVPPQCGVLAKSCTDDRECGSLECVCVPYLNVQQDVANGCFTLMAKYDTAYRTEDG